MKTWTVVSMVFLLLLSGTALAQDHESVLKRITLDPVIHAVHDRPVLILTGAQTGAIVTDGITTRNFVHAGYVEGDPFTRALLGSRPTWARMAPLGALQVSAEVWLAGRLGQSHNRWVRRMRVLPLIAGIAANVYCAAYNSSTAPPLN